MQLVITEKPSVARDLARVLGAATSADGYLHGNGLTLTWCLGHLVELEDPAHYNERWKRWTIEALPMVPESFACKLRKGTKDRWTVMRRLLRDSSFSQVINACDAGREGELIFRRVYEHAGCTLPTQRLWLSSMTDIAIRDAWGKLTAGTAYDNLADAARCRSEADWLVGLNATRAMTVHVRQGRGRRVMSVGRVQTPTLVMIVERDRAIEAFVPETYWLVSSKLQADEQELCWDGLVLGLPKVKKSRGDAGHRFTSREQAEQVMSLLKDASGVVTVSERKRGSTAPPLLYDLTSLQQRANQRYGFAASHTLTVAQALYERHKLLTYPRTDARFLTPDQMGELPRIVRGLQQLPVYAPFCDPLLAKEIRPGKRVINGEEVGDHHAIIPTGRTPAPSRLNSDEKRLFDLVARRFLAALHPPSLFEQTRLVVDATGIEEASLPEGVTPPVRLFANGKITLEAGWKVVDPPKADKEKNLPDVAVGHVVKMFEAKTQEKQTQPPKHYTDGTLLKAMETAGKTLDEAELKRAMRRGGLGTPATRANILQTLLDRSFVERKKTSLISTQWGRLLVDAVPDDAVKSPKLTGHYEHQLALMAEGKVDARSFMQEVVAHTGKLVVAIAESTPPEMQDVEVSTAPSQGKCPQCGEPVREERAVFTCDTGRSCSFVVFKKMAKRTISARMVKALLTEGRSPIVKGFKSKKGKEFSAGLIWDEKETRVGFYFPPRAGDACPACETGRVIRGKKALGCSRWREGCAWRSDT